MSGMTTTTTTPLSGRRRDDEWCKRCDRAVVIGYSVAAGSWLAVAGEFQVLCAPCFDELAHMAGIPYQFIDTYPIPWSCDIP